MRPLVRLAVTLAKWPLLKFFLEYLSGFLAMRLSVKLFIIHICLLGCLSCGDRKKLVDIGVEQQILHIANGNEIADIDPQITTGMPENRVIVALSEGLTLKDPRTLKVIPGVAERWEVSSDGMTYKFFIRENAKWSNGDDLTANDFVQSWRRSFLPALGNQYASSLYVIKNAQAFHEGKVTFDQVGVKALDQKNLRGSTDSSHSIFSSIARPPQCLSSSYPNN